MKFVLLMCVALAGCRGQRAEVARSIEFTQLPPAGEGSPDKLHAIAGRVVGGVAGQRIVLYARSGMWWVQPTASAPFTDVAADRTWKNSTHPGSAYAALLVNAEYVAPLTMAALPAVGRSVSAVATAEGTMLARPEAKTLHFSGYRWQLREVASDRGGTRNYYDAANGWTDKNGHLHLRLARKGDRWSSAEVSLTRSLGYGTYRLVVRDISHLEPAVVFSMFTWDDEGPAREMDIEIGRWGEPASKNAQFVVQPYYVPANSVRFNAPAGRLTHWFRWEPGQASFATVRSGGEVVAEHTFTSGIPLPGKEAVHLNLYLFDNKRNPLREACEVVIEKFEYLP
ncbi:MAG: hypothetical protein JWP63_3939 [Candidatus Solibacter sp.]|nr:hypothetical protein [Candidatus Solibacter sp.]